MAKPKPEDRPNIESERAERPKRVPIHGYKNRFSLEGAEPGWHYCVVNDYNISKYERAGYEFVTHPVVFGDHKVGQATSMTDGKFSIAVGNGVTGYLMRCPEEVFKEEMEANDQLTNEREEAMFSALNGKEEGRYGSVKKETLRH